MIYISDYTDMTYFDRHMNWSYPEVGVIQYIVLPFDFILWKYVLKWHDPITLSIKGYKRGQRMSS